MKTESSSRLQPCPCCNAVLDPLRAGAVSIIDGRIVHFCNAECREAFLKRGDAPGRAATPYSVPAAAVSEDAETASLNESLPAINEPAPVQVIEPTGREFQLYALHRTARWAVESVLFLLLTCSVWVIPHGFLGGWLAFGLTIAGILPAAVFSFLRDFRGGHLRALNSQAIPVASALLVLLSVIQELSVLPLFGALLLLAFESLGRLGESLLRRRSGVIDLLESRLPGAMVPEWRDNSAMAVVLQRATLVFEWGRLPLAFLLGLFFWMRPETGAAAGILASAIALVVWNPRLLRMIAGDAYLAVAIRAARKNITFRDADAVDSVARSQVVLFMTSRVLVRPEVVVSDWTRVDGVDGNQLLSALGAVEKGLDDRFARAIFQFVRSRNVPILESIVAERFPGQGVRAGTVYGDLICGTRGALLEQGISTAEHEHWASDIEKTGRRAFFVALDGRVGAMFSVAEEPVPGVQEAVHRLTVDGLEVAMVTSAEVDAATAFGTRLRIHNVQFEKSDAALGGVLADIKAFGDQVLLVGSGERFDEQHAEASVAIHTGESRGNTFAVDARNASMETIATVIADCRSARRSVVANLMVALQVMLIGTVAALDWHYPMAVPVCGGLVLAAQVVSTLNGPYVRLDRAVKFLEKQIGQAARRAGMIRD